MAPVIGTVPYIPYILLQLFVCLYLPSTHPHPHPTRPLNHPQCVNLAEPVLLVGETGSGKTTAVQELAALVHHTLLVQNLSLSTDSSDLLGKSAGGRVGCACFACVLWRAALLCCVVLCCAVLCCVLN